MIENIHLWKADRGTYFDRNVNKCCSTFSSNHSTAVFVISLFIFSISSGVVSSINSWIIGELCSLALICYLCMLILRLSMQSKGFAVGGHIE